MKTYLLLILLISFAPFTTMGQQYYIKTNGDTIYGKVNLNPIFDNSRSIRFISNSGEKIDLKPHWAKEVFYKQDMIFKPVIHNNQRLFMAVISDGTPLSAYTYVYELSNKMERSRILSKNGETLVINKFNFKNQMIKFLEDCPEIVSGLEEKKYRLKFLGEMVGAYNNCSKAPTLVSGSNNSLVDNHTDAVVVSTTAPKQNLPEPMATSKSTEPEMNAIASFKEYIENADQISNKSDILELLKDLENRWQKEREIPGYLWSALEGMANNDEGLAEKVKALKDQLSENRE